MNTKMIEKIVARTTDRTDENWGMNINQCDWVPGVGLYGIFNAWKATKNPKYLEFLEKWVEKNGQKVYDLPTVNSTAPLLTIVNLYEVTKKPEYLKLCTDIAEWITKEAPKTSTGGFEHTVTEDVEGFSEQIWADTLFMACIFLTKFGKITGKKEYVDEAINQLKIHHKILKDKETGLFFHGYNGMQKNHMSAARWARANAWITVSTTEIIDLVGEDFEGRDEVIKSLLEQVEAFEKYQREDGSFGTLIDVEDAYSEASATAGIAYGIKNGIRIGIIPEKYMPIAQKAEKFVESCVNEDGEVLKVSSGTPVMPTADDYKTIICEPTLYGQALALMMFSL